MKLNRILFVALAVGATPLAAQQSLVFNLNGGGYGHLANLNATGAPTADFKPGYNFGASVGYQVNQFLGFHGDFTFAHATARGASSFSGGDIHRAFYGVHAELRYPFESGVTPFAFAGAGAVTVDQARGSTVPRFTRTAGMLGAGIGYAIPNSRIEIFGEGKTLVYRWNEAGFNKTLWDLTYSMGVAYHLPL